jgi:hypothetical protein
VGECHGDWLEGYLCDLDAEHLAVLNLAAPNDRLATLPLGVTGGQLAPPPLGPTQAVGREKLSYGDYPA